MQRTRNVAIVLYDKVEILDFAGPYEAFMSGSNRGQDFRVFSVAEQARPVITFGNLSINPAYTFDNFPKPDILLIPGGPGSRKEMHNNVLIDWIRTQAEEAELLLSVCTGALIVVSTGLVEGMQLTTNRLAMEELRQVAPPTATILDDVRYVDNGNVIFSAGVSAGIDMSLYVIGKLLGQERALQAARLMEYDWRT